MVCKVGCIVQDICGNKLIITDVDMKELVYTVYNLSDEEVHGSIYAENQKRHFDQIHLLLDSSKLPLFKVGDKVVWVKKFEKDMEEGESGIVVSPPKFRAGDKTWGYDVMLKTDHGYQRAFTLEKYLVKDENKEPVKSIEELLIEVGTRINAENPDYICAVTKTEEGLYAGENISVVFKCLATHPNLCEKRVISLHDAEDGAEKLLNFIGTRFNEFKQTCEAQRKMEQVKIDYTKFFNNNPKIYGKEVDLSVFARPRGNGKTELRKILMNGVYGANGNVYKGGYVYPEPDKPNKDFWDAAWYAFVKPYTNAVLKIIKEELGMNVTKVNKKQEEELEEFYAATPIAYRPKRIIFNGPATIVIWQTDTKTVVKCGGNEEYDRKLAFKYALHKRYAELKKTNYLRQFTKALEKTGDPQAAFIETFAKIEMNNRTVGEGDRYFKAIEKRFKKEFES